MQVTVTPGQPLTSRRLRVHHFTTLVKIALRVEHSSSNPAYDMPTSVIVAGLFFSCTHAACACALCLCVFCLFLLLLRFPRVFSPCNLGFLTCACGGALCFKLLRGRFARGGHLLFNCVRAVCSILFLPLALSFVGLLALVTVPTGALDESPEGHIHDPAPPSHSRGVQVKITQHR